MAPLLLPVIYLTFISLMALALLAASAFPPNALRKAEGRMRLEAALDGEGADVVHGKDGVVGEFGVHVVVGEHGDLQSSG